MKKLVLFVVLALFIGLLSKAQWNSDPSQNTPLSTAPGEQALPKIAACTDGSVYIAWFSVESGNYNVRLQRLDKDGVALWEPGGILISDNTQDTWITDWDMSVDASDYALLVFSDIRSGTLNPYGYRVSPSGEMMYGENGAILSGSPNFEPSPKVCGLPSGNAVFAWQSEGASSEVRLQKVAPDGQLLWGTGIVFLSTSADYTSPFVAPATGDQVYLLWHKQTGPFYAPNRSLCVQLLDENGAPVWPTDAVVYAPVPSGIVVSLDMCSDDAGGFIFTWYRNDQGLHFHSYIQHMDADGNVTMPAGTLLSTATERNHMYPTVAFLSQTQEIIAYFSEQDLNQNDRGLYAQKLDLAGNRLWTDAGKMLIPLSPNDISLPAASGFEDKAICIYEVSGSSGYTVQAVMLNSAGEYVWPGQFIDMCTIESMKYHRVMSGYFWGQWVATWGDERGADRDIYAQNIQPDGTLGQVMTAIGNKYPQSDFSISISPNPFVNELVFEISDQSSGNAGFEMFDNMGKTIIKGYLNSLIPKYIFDGANLPAGIYFIRIDDNKTTSTSKVVKF
jgi:hypothetical protein